LRIFQVCLQWAWSGFHITQNIQLLQHSFVTAGLYCVFVDKVVWQGRSWVLLVKYQCMPCHIVGWLILSFTTADFYPVNSASSGTSLDSCQTQWNDKEKRGVNIQCISVLSSHLSLAFKLLHSSVNVSFICFHKVDNPWKMQ
jgi:hypothetical protein